MTPPPAVGAGTLRRLGAIGDGDHGVLSIYLDLAPAHFPTPAARASELGALLAQAHRDGAAADAERVRRLLQDAPGLLRNGRGVAVFSCAGSGTLEAVTLPEPVEPLAVYDDGPWLEPLVTLVTAERWGVAVLGGRGARLFRGGRRGLVEFGSPAGDVRHAAERLLRAHRRRPFEHLVLIAGPELWPLVEPSLHPELRDRLAGHVEHDLEHAAPDEIVDAIVPVVERAELLRR